MSVLCSTCGKNKFPEGTTCDVVGCPIYLINQPLPDQDHWTMPEDPEVEARPGWGPVKLDKIWWSVELEDFKDWHDRITKRGSIVQKLGASVKRINQAQRELLKDKGLGGFIVHNFLKPIQRFFYEGKLK